MGPTIYSLINTEVRIFHAYVYSPLINFSYVNQNVGLLYCGENTKKKVKRRNSFFLFLFKGTGGGISKEILPWEYNLDLYYK